MAHRGATTARNVGADLASGDMLMFLDADDVLGTDALEHLAIALAGHDDAVAVGPWCRLELADGTWQRGRASCAPRRPGDDALAGWLRNWYHPPCAVLWNFSAMASALGHPYWLIPAVAVGDGSPLERDLRVEPESVGEVARRIDDATGRT